MLSLSLHAIWHPSRSLQLQELIDAADGVLCRCSKSQAEEIEAKQQAVVENWESLRHKVEQCREQLEETCRLYRFQAEVSASVFCLLLKIKVLFHGSCDEIVNSYISLWRIFPPILRGLRFSPPVLRGLRFQGELANQRARETGLGKDHQILGDHQISCASGSGLSLPSLVPPSCK